MQSYLCESGHLCLQNFWGKFPVLDIARLLQCIAMDKQIEISMTFVDSYFVYSVMNLWNYLVYPSLI